MLKPLPSLFCSLALTAACGLWPSVARAERASAANLLPKATVAYVRIADAPKLRERFSETSLARIARDEQMAPIVAGAYKATEQAWSRIEERVGLPLDKLLAIPQGEACFAWVPRVRNAEGMFEGPSGFVVLLDVKDHVADAQTLLDKGRTFLEENGGAVATEKVGDVQLNVFTGGDGGSVIQFEKDGTIVISSTKTLATFLIENWAGAAEPLASHDRFASVMSRCGNTADDPPQLTFYVDPVEIARVVGRQSAAGRVGLAVLPVLGVDGLQALGGSMTFATEDFDSIMQVHLLLESPRSGVVEALALGSGDTTPESWVPAASSGYNTMHWDVGKTYQVAAKLFNSLQSEGALEAEVQRRISEPLGADFEKEILPLLDGRMSLAFWVDPESPKVNSHAPILGIKLTDPQAFAPVFEKIRTKMGDRLVEESFAGQTYYATKRNEASAEPSAENETVRVPDPCMAIVGNYFIMTDSSLALKETLLSMSDPARQLANDLEYKLIASRIKRQLKGQQPGLLQYNKPEVSMKLFYELLVADRERGAAAKRAEGSDFFKQIDETMKEHPLPPFSVIAKYLAPGGGMITNDESGFHYTAFTLRRK